MANLVLTHLSVTVFVGGGMFRRHHIRLSPADVRCVPAAPVGGMRKGIQTGGGGAIVSLMCNNVHNVVTTSKHRLTSSFDEPRTRCLTILF